MRFPSLRKFKQTDFQVWFLRKDHERFVIMDKKKLFKDKNSKDLSGTISYKDKTFIIPQQSCLEDKNNHIIFFDYNNEKIIAFHEIELGYDAKLIDQLLVKKIISFLVSSIKSSLKENPSLTRIGVYVLCIGFGVLTGYIIGTMYPLSVS
jgi:hypothetical protein